MTANEVHGGRLKLLPLGMTGAHAMVKLLTQKARSQSHDDCLHLSAWACPQNHVEQTSL